MRQKIIRATLACYGIGAVAFSILWDLMRGQRFTPGWIQFIIFSTGCLALISSLAIVWRAFGALVDRSRRESEATLKMWQHRPMLYVLCSLWFALAFGFGESFFWLYEQLIIGRLSPWRVDIPGFHYLWGIPLGYVVMFGAVGLLCFGLVRWWPQRVTFPWILSVFLFCGSFAMLLLVPGLDNRAAAVLAIGLTIQLVRLAGRHAFIFSRLVRNTFPIMAFVVLALPVGLFGWPYFATQNELARQPEPEENAPNVLFIVLDTVRARSLSLYGYERATTPNLDAFAAGAVVFERAIATAPWTLPSHASMFTGRFPHELTANFTVPLDATYPTIAEVLRNQGFGTAGFVANTAYGPAGFGLGRGFTRYEAQHFNINGFMKSNALGYFVIERLTLAGDPHHRKTAARVNSDFLRWLDGRPRKRPYFAFLNYFDAHAPYLPPPEFAFSKKKHRGKVGHRPPGGWSPEDFREMTDAYDGTLAYLDSQLGQLFAELESREESKNTIVIITSDHGEQLGERDMTDHGNSLYLPLLHVPLVVKFPGRVPEGLRVQAPVSLADLPATILELTGTSDPKQFPGQSLSRYWNRSPGSLPPAEEMILAEVTKSHDRHSKPYPAEKGPMAAIFYNGMHYIKNYGDGHEELYEVKSKFRDEIDIGAQEKQQLEMFSSYLDRLRKKGGTARAQVLH